MMNDNVKKDDLFGQNTAAEIMEFPEMEKTIIKMKSKEYNQNTIEVLKVMLHNFFK